MSHREAIAQIDIVEDIATRAEPDSSSSPVVVPNPAANPVSSEPSATLPVVKHKQSVDRCPNLRGDQKKVPKGYELKNKRCVKVKVVGKPAPPREGPPVVCRVMGPPVCPDCPVWVDCS
jgi:hypothetical protein